jgi:hypothetical protein
MSKEMGMRIVDTKKKAGVYDNNRFLNMVTGKKGREIKII